MWNSLLSKTILDSMQISPIFIYILAATVVIYIVVEILLLLSRGLYRDSSFHGKFCSEIVWVLVPAIFIISLVYMV